MAALKDYYSRDFVRRLASELRKGSPSFDAIGFEKKVLYRNWKNLELKERVRHISTCMNRHLPFDYKKQIAILEKAAPGFTGLEGFVFPDFVEVFGLEDFDTSVRALERFTEYSTSEFAVRPFLIRYEAKMMQQMLRWAEHPNHHVRRLASEGCRPRLPWAIALVAFKKDPAPVLPVLELLKNDPSEYVRRSVANNLNDIAKDHPGLTLEIRKAMAWSKQRNRLDREACVQNAAEICAR